MSNNSIHKVKSGIYEKGQITLEEIIGSFKNNPKIKNSGAILSFTGIVRSFSSEGEPVINLKIEAYREIANRSIETICSDILKIDGINDVVIVHFQGEFDISEDLVHVVVASSHRESGFKALQIAVERYKKEIAVWKKETFSNGTSKWDIAF